MEMGEKIHYLRKRYHMTLQELGDKVGVTKSTVRKWENGMIENMRRDKILKVAKALSVSPEYLMGWKDQKEKKSVDIPVLGCIAAGIPIEAIEYIVDYEEIPAAMARTGEYFGLLIKGRSMEPQIYDGDVIIVRRQPDIESGSIAVVLVNGEEGTCKRILKSDMGITLVSFNPAFDPVFFSNKQIQELPVQIIGKAVEIRRKLL